MKPIALCICVVFCLNWISVQPATVLRNSTLTFEDLASTVGCDFNSSSPQLTFITSLSIRGCPIFVHRVGEVKAGRFVVEPTFCITDADSVRRPSAHFDLLTKQHYYSFPVKVTDESMLPEIEPQLRRYLVKSISFLDLTSIRLNTSSSFAYKNLSFIWAPTELNGYLRVICAGFQCQSLRLYLSMGQTEAFESINLEATMQVAERCDAVTRTYPITIANYPFLPVSSLQRARLPDARICSDLIFYTAVQIDSCTVYVYKRQDKKGHFVIEPLLCPRGNFSLLTDYSLGRHYLVMMATVKSSTIIDRVRRFLNMESEESIVFMNLWDAQIYVSDYYNQWQVPQVRLSLDRTSAELRVYCADYTSCELLGSILSTEPINFWKTVQWTATFMIGDECEVNSDRRRFAFRMIERALNYTVPNAGRAWNLQALQSRIVNRNGRPFVVFLQRGCKKSNFQRYWIDYVDGFGDEDNFWIGLDILHSLTRSQDTRMRVELLLWNDTEWFAEYSGFSVGSSSNMYIMSYSAMLMSKSSLIYDAMAHSINKPFSTRDVDNVRYSSTGYCSSYHGYGGWWFNTCTHANPTGIYSFAETSGATYALWYFVEGFKAIKEIRMMVQL